MDDNFSTSPTLHFLQSNCLWSKLATNIRKTRLELIFCCSSSDSYSQWTKLNINPSSKCQDIVCSVTVDVFRSPKHFFFSVKCIVSHDWLMKDRRTEWGTSLTVSIKKGKSSGHPQPYSSSLVCNFTSRLPWAFQFSSEQITLSFSLAFLLLFPRTRMDNGLE